MFDAICIEPVIFSSLICLVLTVLFTVTLGGLTCLVFSVLGFVLGGLIGFLLSQSYLLLGDLYLLIILSSILSIFASYISQNKFSFWGRLFLFVIIIGCAIYCDLIGIIMEPIINF